jgi:hypothetical protein
VNYEKVVEQLREAPLAYNKPDTMVRGRPTLISLVIDVSNQEDLAKEFTGQEGEVVKATTKIARQMSAELTGNAFNIEEPKGNQQKIITEVARTRWDWQVTPIEEGKNKILVLSVYAHIEIVKKDGDIHILLPPVPIRTFRTEIQVYVNTYDRIVDAATAFSQIHAGIIGIITLTGSLWGVFVWWRRKQWRGQEAGEAGNSSKAELRNPHSHHFHRLRSR